jgi:hypothetical protein
MRWAPWAVAASFAALGFVALAAFADACNSDGDPHTRAAWLAGVGLGGAAGAALWAWRRSQVLAALGGLVIGTAIVGVLLSLRVGACT